MKIALIGYGRMGKAIEKIAQERGHEITARIDKDGLEQFATSEFLSSDVAIEFSVPSSAYSNCARCIGAGIPVVSGTTGWNARLDEIRDYCRTMRGTFLFASNFSVSMNIFFEINRRLAWLMQRQSPYTPSMEETHHIHKLDAPSGTAVTLAEDIVKAYAPKLKGWKLGNDKLPDDQMLEVNAFRIGEVPGTHKIRYKSDVDMIEITHEAYGREGFALGAVLAAEYAATHSGVLEMKDLLFPSENE